MDDVLHFLSWRKQKDLIIVKKNVIYERAKFNMWLQGDSETVDSLI